MLCQECGENTATVTINTVINGVKSSRRLCEQCAGKLGVAFPNLGELLSGFFTPVGIEAAAPPELQCPDCGYRFSQFFKTSFLGCDKCYTHFREQLRPFVKRVQGGLMHKEENGPVVKEQAITAVNPLVALREALRAAIKNEEYEKAAELRDEIKAQEGKTDKPQEKSAGKGSSL